jgi:hypothetical protein
LNASASKLGELNDPALAKALKNPETGSVQGGAPSNAHMPESMGFTGFDLFLFFGVTFGVFVFFPGGLGFFVTAVLPPLAGRSPLSDGSLRSPGYGWEKVRR